MVHTGGCHCGQVRFELSGDVDLTNVYACNCSICARAGWLLVFAKKEQFKLLSGEEVLKDYQFAKKRTHHKFCSSCGVRSFSHGTDQKGAETVAVNVRCVDGVNISGMNLTGMKVTEFDGKAL